MLIGIDNIVARRGEPPVYWDTKEFFGGIERVVAPRRISTSQRQITLAKPLVFQFGDKDLSFGMTKVDRSKLYGYKEVEALDEQGERCSLATLADDGRTVVARGGTGLGYLTVDGQWRDKGQLRPVDALGNGIEPVPSSFSAPTKLFDDATMDDLLGHNIRMAYLLSPEGEVGELVNELSRGTIFTFPYSYRGGLEPDVGFLMLADDHSIFLLVGTPTKTSFIGLQSLPPEEEAIEEENDSDAMDFDMI
jgi:hypothetical protein